MTSERTWNGCTCMDWGRDLRCESGCVEEDALFVAGGLIEE